MLSPSQTQSTVASPMMAVLPQSGQRQRRANGLANEEQWHWLSGCFMASLLGTFAIKAAVQPISGMLREPAPLAECRMRWLPPSLRLSMGSAVVRLLAQPQSAHRLTAHRGFLLHPRTLP